MKIGVFGGSFNPPHKGHLHLANEVSGRLELDKVIIIPSNISPQKEHNGHIDPVHRINMCKAVFDSYLFQVSDCEISRGGKSYTFDTLTYLKEQYPDGEFYLFMGSDMLLSFHTWFRYADILKMCALCAVSREDDESAAALRAYSDTVLKDGNVYIFDIEPFEVSSSEIRKKLKNGENCDELLDWKTIEYIKENKLYGQ